VSSLFRNTLAQSTPIVIGYAFSLALAPLMLSRLGLEAFGVWAVTGALATYAGLLDLGIGRSLSRFVSLYHSKGDRRSVEECVGLGLVAVTVLGSIAAGAAYLGASVLSGGLNTPADELRVILLCSVAIFVLQMWTDVLASVPTGMLQMVPPSLARLAGNTVNFGASVAVLLVSDELTDYALANVAAAAVALVIMTAVFARTWRAPYARLPSRARAKEVIGFGVRLQVVWLGDLVNQQTDKLIIALLVSPAAAGAYELANRVVLALRSLGVLTISAMIPTATAAIAREGNSIVRGFYRNYTGKSVAISLPIFAFGAITGPYLLVAWLGEAPGESPAVLALLGLANAANLVTGVPMTLITSDGRPGVPAFAAVVTAALNVVLTLALAPFLGLWGVLLGTVVALTAGAVLFLVQFHRAYGFPARDLADALLRPLVLAVGLALPFAAWYLLLGETPESRLPAAVGLAITGGAYVLAYWLAASRLELLPDRLNVRRLRPVAG
jgi:O-antigen/teichoic acid export membrane protein